MSDHDEIVASIVEALASYGTSLDHTVSLATFGVDSIDGAAVAAKVGDAWGVHLAPETMTFLSINQIADLIKDARS